MSKLTAPLFSLTARGTIGDALTYSGWRGVEYVRTRVVPANPKTANQIAVRNCFTSLNNLWNKSPTLFRQHWLAYAMGQPFTDRNAIIGINAKLLKGEVNMSKFRFSPGAGGALPPLTITVTPGAGTLTVACTVGETPPGWTLVGAIAALFVDGNPKLAFSPLTIAMEDDVSPYSMLFPGLAAVLHRVGVWLKWTAPDLSTRYSISLEAPGTPT